MTRERASPEGRERENKWFSKSCPKKSRGYNCITTGRINFKNTKQYLNTKIFKIIHCFVFCIVK